MAKFEFKKEKNTEKPNAKHELKTVELPKPKESYSAEDAESAFENSTKQDESKIKYRNIRTTVRNVDRMKSFETVLNIKSHNEFLDFLLNRLETQVDNDQLSTYQLMLKSYMKNE
ncbi:hypothetical protein [Lactobacillus sp. Sy-1]|uniref:hypothetical protein n=1 Tax=Lactobacillus sp. Sy-1 TaxID=2109645 RepID=UPI001C5B4435|nr:hypothetical protein [Lactobacillus sp. Sy-1]MBW1606448.1 hypothetical protein [Lactobacillus sp. Sy-1]